MTTAAEVSAYEMRGEITHPDAAAARARLSIDELRAATLGALLALATTHNLALPGRMRSADQPDGVGPCLSLDFDQPSDVDAWAAVLGIGPAKSTHQQHDGQTLVSRSADSCVGPGSGAWLSWRQVRLSWQDYITPEQVAAAALTPDDEVLP